MLCQTDRPIHPILSFAFFFFSRPNVCFIDALFFDWLTQSLISPRFAVGPAAAAALHTPRGGLLRCVGRQAQRFHTRREKGVPEVGHAMAPRQEPHDGSSQSRTPSRYKRGNPANGCVAWSRCYHKCVKQTSKLV